MISMMARSFSIEAGPIAGLKKFGRVKRILIDKKVQKSLLARCQQAKYKCIFRL